MNDRLQTLRLFSRVARTGSFSRTAREAGLSQPSVSRLIAELEREIGAALLVRTTRAVTLTDAGADYLARIEPVLDALDEADHAVRGTGELRGLVRVALSSSFGIREVIPRLPHFLASHPALRVDLVMSDLRQDLVSDGVDVALRLGDLEDTSATARKLGSTPRVLVAAPDYLARAGTPDNPAELADHDMLSGPAGSTGRGWSFMKGERRLSLRLRGRITIGANEGTTAAAVAGLGVAAMSMWGCRRELASGSLVRVLPDWSMGDVACHAVFPARRAAKPAARAFATFVSEGLHAADG